MESAREGGRLTLWSTALVGNLIVAHLVKKFTGFYVTGIFIAIFQRPTTVP
jgi:hypothetical protein